MAWKSILIVEDEQSIREALVLALELKGYRVFAASNGKEGLEVLSKMPHPSVILLDLMMPVMDGWQFAVELKKRTEFSDIPVLLLTAFEEKAKTIPAKEIIKKPVDLNYLYETIGRYCGNV